MIHPGKLLFVPILLLVFSAHGQRLNVNIAYPVPVNSFTGIFSAEATYIHRLQQPTAMGYGVMFCLLNDHNKDLLINYGLQAGVNRMIALSASINTSPFLYVGYNRFQYNNNYRNAAHLSLGLNIMHTSVRRIGCNISYRQYISNSFVYPDGKNAGGSFGLLLTGLHVYLE